eukprot:scaffold362_cov176-Amphora_coffeaeformis.AAC.9
MAWPQEGIKRTQTNLLLRRQRAGPPSFSFFLFSVLAWSVQQENNNPLREEGFMTSLAWMCGQATGSVADPSLPLIIIISQHHHPVMTQHVNDQQQKIDTTIP